MVPEYRFPLKRKRGFLHIGTSVSNLRNWSVKPSGILTEYERKLVISAAKVAGITSINEIIIGDNDNLTMRPIAE